MIGALSYSGGLSFLLESPRVCLHGSLTSNTHQPLDSYVGLSFSQLAVQNTERQVCTFGFKLHIVGRSHLDVGMLYLMLPRDAL